MNLQENIHPCPICGKEAVWGNGIKECPQCKSNLHVFSIIDEMTHPRNELKKKILQKLSLAFSTLKKKELSGFIKIASVCLLTAVFYFYLNSTNKRIDSLENKGRKTESVIGSGVSSPKTHIKKMHHHPSRIKSTVQSGNLKQYIMGKNDSLWNMAEKYWGKGAYYPVLLEHNPWLSPILDNQGLRVQITKDKEQVRRDYENIIVRVSDVFFFKYRVRPQDTWETITRTFLRRKEDRTLLKQINHHHLKTGRRILIPMKMIETGGQ